ncbi:MAG: class I SAM-dependent methyltransferase [Planctomycetes bacterium]|nr:class I SAM-dependent methyltransferase [Planctomycetota bacterium]
MHRAPTPQLSRLIETAKTVWEADPTLATRFGSIESMGYWQWILTSGTEEHAALDTCLPVPPDHLIGRVIGASSGRERYRDSGLSDSHNVLEALSAGGWSFDQPGSMLDFGCGCARILRCFARFADSWQLVGTDIDANAIAWCRSHFDFIRFETLPFGPPTPFRDEEFTAAYAFSVFSHLPVSLHLDWLEELRRITRPGAALALTVMGHRCYEKYVDATASDVWTPEGLADDRARWTREGILYYPYPSPMPSLPEEDQDKAVYGITFLTPSYIEERWSEYFDVVEIRKPPQDWQDYVVLRRR